jgi:secreted trypsin-like serine protease
VGYGVTDYAQEVLPNFAKKVHNPVMKCRRPSSKTVCTKGIEHGTNRRGNTCGGDSGGPLVVNGKLVAVLSEGNADCGRDSVDTATYCSIAAHVNYLFIIIIIFFFSFRWSS